MTDYFTTLSKVTDIKQAYCRLAKAHHPNLGGHLPHLQEVNRQYQEALKACDFQVENDREYSYFPDVEQELMEKLLDVLRLRSLNVTLIGYWIWVTGDTKRHNAVLRAAGLRWHGKRKAWYYKPKGWKGSYQAGCSLNDLAHKYGYKGFKRS